MSDRRDVTEAISVSHHGGWVHLSIATHFKDGEFLTLSVLLSSAHAKDLAAVMDEIADRSEAVSA